MHLVAETNPSYEPLPCEVTLKYDRKQKCWEARMPELQNVIAYGNTPSHAVCEVTFAARAWIETAIQSGITIPAAKPQD